MENLINYKVRLTSDARNDIVQIKRYIINRTALISYFL